MPAQADRNARVVDARIARMIRYGLGVKIEGELLRHEERDAAIDLRRGRPGTAAKRRLKAANGAETAAEVRLPALVPGEAIPQQRIDRVLVDVLDRLRRETVGVEGEERRVIPMP